MHVPEDAVIGVAELFDAVRLEAGAVLLERGDPSDCLYLVVDGALEVVSTYADGGERIVRTIGGGGSVGETGLLQGRLRSDRVRCAEAATLLRLDAAHLDALRRAAPELVRVLDRHAADVAAIVHGALRRTFGDLPTDVLDAVHLATAPVRLRSGDVLCTEGDPGDGVYLLLRGRLAVTVGDELVAEVMPGDLVGEMALLTGGARTATVYAIRDCELAHLTTAAWQAVTEAHPLLLAPILRTLARRLARRNRSVRRSEELRAITLVLSPALDDGDGLARAFCTALGAIERVEVVDRRRFEAVHGSGAADTPRDGPRAHRLSDWMNALEQDGRCIVYVAEDAPSAWTQRCIDHSDRLYLFADPSEEPSRRPLEDWLSQRFGQRAPPVALVLVHPDGTRHVHGTAAWLDPRPGVRHHHLRRDDAADMARLTRFVAGTAVGVVLGGGAARSFAHMGVLKALQELGVPIDAIGGASMGAAVAFGFAGGMTPDEIVEGLRRIFVENRFTSAVTWPSISLLDTGFADKSIRMHGAGRDLEDLWLPYFAVSSNLSKGRVHEHTRGTGWRAVRASGALPVLMPPAFQDGDVLVDGGLLDNLPVARMRRHCPGPVIAVDVSPIGAITVDPAFEDPPTGMQLFWSKVNPFKSRPPVPTLVDILMATLACGGTEQMERARADADLLIAPPIDTVGLMGWDAIDAVVEAGYTHTLAQADALRRL